MIIYPYHTSLPLHLQRVSEAKIKKTYTFTCLILLGLMGYLVSGCTPKTDPILKEFNSSQSKLNPSSSLDQPVLVKKETHVSHQNFKSQQSKKQSKQVWTFVGDSLTAGFGVAASESYVSLLEHQLHTQYPNLKLINAGVSGDTSAGVLRRLDWILQDHPNKIFLCIGANDGLRGLSLDQLEANLDRLITRIQKAGVEVVLMGIMIPPNYGPKYTDQFKAIYPRMARKYKLKFLPFLLEGVAGEPQFNQGDGIHPNAQGHQNVAHHVFQFIQAQIQP